MADSLEGSLPWLQASCADCDSGHRIRAGLEWRVMVNSNIGRRPQARGDAM